MEAIAGLSLACNIIQLVETAIEAADVIRQVYKDGSTDENSAVADRSSHIQALSADLDQTLQNAKRQKLSSIDLRLVGIAEECRKVSAKLSQELDKLQPTGGRRDALLKGIRTWRKKDDIEKLRLRLLDHERTLNTGLLIALKQHADTMTSLEPPEFHSLDPTIRQFIQSLAAGVTKCSDLVLRDGAATRALITKEHGQISNQIMTNFSELQLATEATAQRTQLLESLAFPEMNARMNQIADSEETTFEWLFGGSATATWANFSTWLQSDETLYWIHGKAGSGKSTLMKFIIEHDTTRNFLLVWSQQRELTYLSAGLWLSGTPLQRSVHGLMCSLLHQILSQSETVSQALCKRNPKVLVKMNVNDWSQTELLMALKATMQYRAQESPICVFLDGLDELDKKEDPNELLKIILTLAGLDGVKFCVSSRPEPFWANSMKQQPTLRLQDLTYSDIELYTTRKLQPYLDHNTTNDIANQSDRHELIHEIVRKADGVFLWVRLACHALVRGLAVHSTLDELHKRLEYLPSDLEELYRNMLSRTGDDWQVVEQEAALYFHICLKVPEYGPLFRTGFSYSAECQLFHHMLCESYWRQDWPDILPQFTEFEFNAACERIKSRIEYVCVGMVEVDERSREDQPSQPFMALVRLSHRTVHDFLQDKAEGQRILASLTVTSEQILHCFDLAMLLCHELDLVRWAWNNIMDFISIIAGRDEGEYRESSIIKLLCLMEQSIHNTFSRKDKNDAEAYKSFTSPAAVGDGRSYQFMLREEYKELYRLGEDWRARGFPIEGEDLAWYLTCDVMGLSLSMGVTCYFNFQFCGDSPKRCSLAELSNVYKDYLLLCAVSGLVRTKKWSMGAPSRRQDRIRIGSLRREAYQVIQELQRSGASTEPIACIGQWSALNYIDTDDAQTLIVAHSPLLSHSDNVPTSNLTARFMKNGGKIRADLSCNQRSLIVSFDAQAFIDFLPMLFSWVVIEDEQELFHPVEFIGKPEMVVLRDDRGDSYGYILQPTSSTELSMRVNALIKKCIATTDIDWDSQEQVDTYVISCIESKDVQRVNMKDFFSDRGYIRYHPEEVVWKEQIPMFEDYADAANTDKSSVQNSHSEEGAVVDNSDSSGVSFKSFEE